MEHLVTTGALDGKRSVGRQREKMQDNLCKWTGITRTTDLIRASSDRGEWQDLIANAVQQGT